MNFEIEPFMGESGHDMKKENRNLIFSWGTLCPEEIPSTRRQQDLGLATAVRYFNDRAVPGLGGLWFPMPLVWSVLAVALTEKLGHKSALPVGNAIEALVMSYAKEAQGSEHKGRVRGSQKLQSITADERSFKNLSRPGVYVVQPIRMAMVQPLIELGFVTGSRYGAFRLGDAGHRLMELNVMDRWLKAFEAWAQGRKPNKDVVSELSPLTIVPFEIRKLIRTRVFDGNGREDVDAQRRCALTCLGKGPSSSQLQDLPDPIGQITESHWTDLRAGAAFMDLRDAALAVLSAIEKELKSKAEKNSAIFLARAEAADVAKVQLNKLKEVAKRGCTLIDAAKESASMAFVSECLNTKDDDLVVKLANRDGSVIKWSDEKLILTQGPAWNSDDRGARDAGAQEGQGPDAARNSDDRGASGADESNASEHYAPQLFRLWNLHCLIQELNGESNPRSPSYPQEASQ